MKSNELKDKAWLTLASRYVLRDRWISVRADTCRMPSGITLGPYYVMEYPDWVHVVALDRDNRLLVTRQYRHGLKRTILELPCGAINAEEPPEAAARRELKEETGISISSVRPVGYFAANLATHTNFVHVFLAHGESSQENPNPDKTEDIDHDFLPIAEVRAAIETGTFAQGLVIASLYLALSVAGKISLLVPV